MEGLTGNKVKGYRTMLGLTQKELGEILGITKQSVSNKENGLTAFTDSEKIILKKLFQSIDDTLTIDQIFF